MNDAPETIWAWPIRPDDDNGASIWTRTEERPGHSILFRRADMVDAEIERLRGEIERLKRERDEAVAANHSARVCADHVGEFVGAGCLVCELDDARSEVERLRFYVDECTRLHEQLVAERQQTDAVVTNAVNLLTSGCEVDHKAEPLEAFRGCPICMRAEIARLRGEVEDLRGKLNSPVALSEWQRMQSELSVLRQRARMPDQVLDALAKLPTGRWETWTSCSFRRISSNGQDGNVLRATIQSDGHPDLTWNETQCQALCDLVNGLRDLLAWHEEGK